MQRSSRFPRFVKALLILFVAAAAGVSTWYVLSDPCNVESVREASALLVHQRDRFDHSYQFATSAARDAVVRPVAELQLILMDTQSVRVPVCMRSAKSELVAYMTTVIRAFLAYGAQEADGTIRELLVQSDGHYIDFAEELEAVKECAPLCFP